ncbi:MAG: RluA family pseudouridine synthase [Bacteroidaceae bacterium]|nr:RluA family pseudouridine synthase [Bacteroidaceae bacterium]
MKNFDPHNRYIVLPVREESTLMEFLMKQMSGTSRNRVKDLLKGHAISVDKKITTQFDTMLKPGQLVQVRRHKQNVELNNKYVSLIYEDKDLVVIDKQPGILSQGLSYTQYCVKNVLDEYFRRRQFKCSAHVVHRLDRETSGLMIYAKSTEIQQIMEQDWRQIVYDRRYVALVCGCMERDGGIIRSWLHEGPGFKTLSSPTDDGGREAVTYFHTLQSEDDYSLVEFRLETGRKNQIRVHMQQLGHPVAGDKKYGDGRNPLGRLALHAFRLHFFHPRTGQPMEFDTPIPRLFQQRFKNRLNQKEISEYSEKNN